MPKVTVTRQELKDLYGGQEVVVSEENTVYVKPLDVKQKLGLRADFDLEIVEDPIPDQEEEQEDEDQDPLFEE